MVARDMHWRPDRPCTFRFQALPPEFLYRARRLPHTSSRCRADPAKATASCDLLVLGDQVLQVVNDLVLGFGDFQW